MASRRWGLADEKGRVYRLLGVLAADLTGRRCLERIGDDDAEGKDPLRGEWEEGDEREFVLEVLKAECEVRAA